MSNLVILFIHLLATLARLLDPGGVRSIVAESLVLEELRDLIHFDWNAMDG